MTKAARLPQKQVKKQKPTKPIREKRTQPAPELQQDDADRKVLLSFRNVEGQVAGTMEFGMEADPAELQQALGLALGEAGEQGQEYQFFYGTQEIKSDLSCFFKSIGEQPSETALPVVYHRVANFRVRPITRASDSLFGHTEAVLCVQFSPDSRYLASGSGDATVRIWDIQTCTPLKTLERHCNWVLGLAFRQDMEYMVSADADGVLVCWDKDGVSTAKVQAHKGPVMSLSWQPLHLNPEPLLVTAGKDTHLRIISFPTGSILLTFSGHLKPVTRVLWGGQDTLFSSSQDQTVKCWDKNGHVKVDYTKHGHWVNYFSLSTQHVLRGGGFDHSQRQFVDKTAMRARACQLYKKTVGTMGQRLATGSDDFTLQLFDSGHSKAKARLSGHQQPVNMVQFSPDGRFIVSCSFDKSLRLWDGYNGAFMATFRGHVGPIYMVCWSADSRFVVSGSKDSTMKVWDVRTRKLMFDLPGHADEVYALDWSRDGARVASGGKDRQVKLWRN